MKQYLCETYFIDSDHPSIVEFSRTRCKTAQSKIETAILLYYAVRDEIRYNPYSAGRTKDKMKASFILEQGQGYCVAKAVLLAACARAMNIPARLGFADVKNHLNTQKLRETMGTDVFVYHGYTELYLSGKWVKATPAFNIELCENFNVKPLEFDGINDSIFHPLDPEGNTHMEYLKDRGTFADLPYQAIMEESKKWYPDFFKPREAVSRDFHSDARDENRSPKTSI